MKTATTLLGAIGIGLCLAPSLCSAQQSQKTLQRSYPIEGQGTLYIQNINGDIQVQGYDGDEIKATIDITYKGPTKRELERVETDVQLGEFLQGDNVVLYIKSPFIEFNPELPEEGFQMHNWDHEYEFHFNFTLQVPKNTRIDVSTIQHGDIEVSNIQNDVFASNINGDVFLSNLQSQRSEASTINGDIVAQYDRAPSESCDYSTINGTIEVLYPESLSAELTFESFNGQFFTNFDYAVLPAEAIISTDEDTPGEYRLESLTSIQIGRGGPTFQFNNFNGDTYIKKQ